MELVSSQLLKFPIFEEHPELLERVNTNIEKLFNSSILETKDFSIGTDQVVIYIKTTSNIEAILKIPKSSFRDVDDSSFFPMHIPQKQAWFLNKLKENDILGPRLLYLDVEGKFFIESFIPEADYKEKQNEFSQADKERIFFELGETMKKFHQMKSNKFGYMILENDNEGKFWNWFELFKEMPDSVKNCCELRGFSTDIKEKLNKIYEEQTDYLKSFNEPCLLHADLSVNNMRVRKINNEWHFSGLIDFADLLSGDPLLDFGEFLGSYGDWEVISLMEKSYLDGGKFTQTQLKAIRFYAIYYCSWWLECYEDPKKIENCSRIYLELIEMKI